MRAARFRLLLGLLALFGLVLSGYLFLQHDATGERSFCDINETINCAAVNTSAYAELFGVPVAFFGLLYYIGLLLFTLVPARLVRLVADGDEQLFLTLLLGYLFFGVAFSAYLTAIEAFVLKVYCPLCVLSAGTVLVSLLVTWLRWRRA